MEKDNFINTIGYDGDSAIIDKACFAKNKSKTIVELLEEGSFRTATATAVYSSSDKDLQLVADKYNELSGSSYTKEQIPRLFGISKVDVKKVIKL